MSSGNGLQRTWTGNVGTTATGRLRGLSALAFPATGSAPTGACAQLLSTDPRLPASPPVFPESERTDESESRVARLALILPAIPSAPVLYLLRKKNIQRETPPTSPRLERNTSSLEVPKSDTLQGGTARPRGCAHRPAALGW